MSGVGRPELAAVARTAAAAAAVVAAAALLDLLRADVLLLLAGPLVLAAVIPGESTYAFRLVVSVAACFAANVVIAWLTDLLGVPFVPAVTTAALLAPVAAAVAAGRLSPRVGRIADAGDGAAAAAGAAVFLVLWLPGHADTAGQALARLLQDGEDNAGHLTLVQAIVSVHADLLRSSARLAGEMTAGQTSYPPGFHLNVALVAMGFDNLFGGASAARHVTVYSYAVIGLEALWAATLVAAVRAVARVRTVGPAVAVVLTAATVVFCVFGPPTGLQAVGAHAQTAALWMFTAQMVAATAVQLGGRPLLRLTLVAAGVVGVSWCWFLVAPLALVPLAAVAWTGRRELGRRWPATVATVAAAGLLSLPPLYYSIRAGSADHLGAGGAVQPVSRAFLAVVLIVAVAAVLMPRRIPGVGARRASGAALALVVLEAAALRWYEGRTPGAGTYYYEKLLFAVAVAAAVVAGAGMVAAVSAQAPAWSRPAGRRAALAGAGVLLAWLSTAGLASTNSGRVLLAPARPGAADVAAMRYLTDSTPPPANAQVLFWGSTLPVSDYFHSRFAAAIYLRNSDARFALLNGNVLTQDDHALLALVRTLPAGIRLITGNAALRQRLSGAGFTATDLARVDMVVIPDLQDSGGAPQPDTSYDFSLRALVQSLSGKQ